jgi:hypothetical protein
MASAKCAECGGNVSDKAEACPHCGALVSRPQTEPVAIVQEKKPAGFVTFAVGFVVLVFVFFLIVKFIEERERTSDTGEIAHDSDTAKMGTKPTKVIYVNGDSVNMREGPSTDSRITRQLGRGEKLVERKREGDWVMVSAHGEVKTGWVHSSLVTSEEPEASPKNATSLVDEFEHLPRSEQTEKLGDVVNRTAASCVPKDSMRKGKDSEGTAYYLVTCEDGNTWMISLRADRTDATGILDCALGKKVGVDCFKPWD